MAIITGSSFDDILYTTAAADELTALVERSKTPGDLSTVLQKCRQIIQTMAGKQKADEFWAGVSARLPQG